MIIKLPLASTSVSDKTAAKAKQVLRKHEREKEAEARAKSKAKTDAAKAKVKELEDVIKTLQTQYKEIKKISDTQQAAADKQIQKIENRKESVKARYNVKMSKLTNRIETLRTRVREVQLKAGMETTAPVEEVIEQAKTEQKVTKKKKGKQMAGFVDEIENHIRMNMKKSKRGVKV